MLSKRMVLVEKFENLGDFENFRCVVDKVRYIKKVFMNVTVYPGME